MSLTKALSLLENGRSYSEAALEAGVSVSRMKKLWLRSGKRRKSDKHAKEKRNQYYSPTPTKHGNEVCKLFTRGKW